MRLSPEQRKLMKGEVASRNLAVSNWPKTGSFVNIAYKLDPNNKWTDFEKGNLQKAFKAFKDKTCIRYSILGN